MLPRVNTLSCPRLALGVLALAGGLPVSLEAQYFGRNKVQYETFDFRVLNTEHFSVHFYPAESQATHDAARMAERWYHRHSENLKHTFDRKPLIFYANHPDFQQTNVIGGFIGQGTGGVTESNRNRVIMPFTGVYADNDHVLGHELVHVFQYDIAGGLQGSGMRGMNALPLWLVEGMAEYLSIGRDDPHTAMWLRDAALRNDLPTIKQLTTDPRFFPYRFGQGLWAYIGGRWGDSIIGPLYRASVRQGFEAGVRSTLGVSTDTLSVQWLAAIQQAYTPLMTGRQRPGEIGTRVLAKSGAVGEMDLSPSLSPDGRYVAFFTSRGVFGVDLYVAETSTGRIVHKLTGPNSDAHFDAISFISNSGTWSPNGDRFAFVVEAQGDDEINIIDVASGDRVQRIRTAGVGEITGPSWSPDGNRLVFSGSRGGISDLYTAAIADGAIEQLTDDRYADVHPAWSPDGRTIAFSSDRGPGTDFERLSYSAPALAVFDLASRAVRLLPALDGAKQTSPQWSPDGASIYFVSDRDGFSDVYRTSLADGRVHQVTRLATGVSGITYLSPALSVASRSGTVAFTVFDNAGYAIYRLDQSQSVGTPVMASGAQPTRRGAPGLTGISDGTGAGTLPPLGTATRTDRVATYLADWGAGLPPSTTQFTVSPYSSKVSLEYVGSPGVGVGIGSTGPAFAGGIAVYFADMLNDKVLGSTLSLNGQSYKDVGGELFYLNQRRRWNLVASVSHTPILNGGTLVGDTVVTLNSGGQTPAQVVDQISQRTYYDQISGTAQYPFSQTRRFETSMTGTRIGSDYDVQRLIAINGQVVDETRSNPPSPDPVSYAQGTAAFVGDYSTFGLTSPVAGGRWRAELSPTVGRVQMQSVMADYRRYLLFGRVFTFAVRGMHYARYGRDAENGQLLSPAFLGDPQLVRGYDASNFDAGECSTGLSGGNSCPEFERLVGSRLAIASAELRIPLLGTREFGLLTSPLLPVEISPFIDAGVAWTSAESPTFNWQRRSADRIPVVSTGLSARVNVFGYAVLEVYYAYPFQRPEKGGHVGFQLAPGW